MCPNSHLFNKVQLVEYVSNVTRNTQLVQYVINGTRNTQLVQYVSNGKRNTPCLAEAAKKQIFCGGAISLVNYVGGGKC